MEPCHFKLKGKCALHKYSCCFCSFRIDDIEGISEMKDYLSIVTIRNNSRNAILISIFSLFISLLTLLIKILESTGNG